MALNLLKEQNDSLSWRAERYLRESIEHSADTTMYEIILLKKINLISDYFNTILSLKKYDSFSTDVLKSTLEDIYRFDDLYGKINQISFKNSTPIGTLSKLIFFLQKDTFL